MARRSTVLWVVVLLVVLCNTVHTIRRRTRTKSSRNWRSRTQTQTRVRPWVPRVVEGQEPRQEQDADLWLPQRVLTQRRERQPEEPWVPQQRVGRLLGNSWLPEDVQQTQQQTIWTQQQQRPHASDCSFNYNEVPEGYIHSFLVEPSRRQFVYPDLVGRLSLVHLSSGTTVIAACPGSGNALVSSSRTYMYITCRRSQLFHGKQPVSLADLGCRKKPKPTLQRGGRCARGARTLRIGWTIRRGLFVPQIDLCFQQRQETTLFASHKIHGRYIDAKVVDPSRPSFKANDMFSVSVRTSYRKNSQRALLGSLLNTTEHLTARGQHFLAKGHLAPDADFVLEAEQDATYYYANAVPQWQAVNNGNWKSLEFAVRRLAEGRPEPLEVWTGTHGTLELPNLRNHRVKLFLGLAFDKEVLPVPALLWKVIHDPATHEAVAIVVVNDVRGRGSSDSWSLSRPPCPDLCTRLSWVDWNTADQTHGLTFCCSVASLRTTIPELPALHRVGLLVS